MTPHTTRPMVDGYGRAISYLRISLTDRCNLRCRYCLPLHAEFMPKSALLSFEELGTLTRAFMARGTRRIRLTGGEPLVRRGVMDFIESFTPFLADGTLDEVTMTTNGALLGRYAQRLVDAGVKRINISLDTLDGERFRTITRSNQFPMVLDGIETALAAGLKLKINTVAMAGINDDEFPRLVRYAHERGMDITFIEIMPLGDVDLDRAEHFMSVEDIRAALGRHFTLERTDYRSAGPANYVRSAETGRADRFHQPDEPLLLRHLQQGSAVGGRRTLHLPGARTPIRSWNRLALRRRIGARSHDRRRDPPQALRSWVRGADDGRAGPVAHHVGTRRLRPPSHAVRIRFPGTDRPRLHQSSAADARKPISLGIWPRRPEKSMRFTRVPNVHLGGSLPIGNRRQRTARR